jgi:hypothetical protein
MRFTNILLACGSIAFVVAGCASHQAGPTRPITIDDDVAWTKALVKQELSDFRSAGSARQGEIRNQILTARMYIADMEYHYYEAGLTRELQDEGLLATAVNLGLTTSATLIPVAQTKTLLSGLATGITGLDKAYTEKELLSNTIQALQTQMRADRKEQAGVIYAKMFKDSTGGITPITEYTLPMALSDLDVYYQAGTVSSALLGLSMTVATKEASADQAKSAAGPNPVAVSSVKVLASPSRAVIAQRPAIIRDVRAPIRRITARGRPGEPTDPEVIKSIRKALCLDPNGGLDNEARKRLVVYMTSIKRTPSDKFLHREMILLNRLIDNNKTADCTKF